MALPSARTWALLCSLGTLAVGAGPQSAQAIGDRVGVAEPDASSISQPEWDFLRRTNEARRAHQLPPLQMAPGLAAVARDWSAAMASQQELGSNPALSSDGKRAENIGHGLSVAHLQSAFLSSPHHLGNLLGDFNYVGIGVVSSSSGTFWVTLDFVKSEQPLASVGEPRVDEGPLAEAFALQSRHAGHWRD